MCTHVSYRMSASTTGTPVNVLPSNCRDPSASTIPPPPLPPATPPLLPVGCAGGLLRGCGCGVGRTDRLLLRGAWTSIRSAAWAYRCSNASSHKEGMVSYTLHTNCMYGGVGWWVGDDVFTGWWAIDNNLYLCALCFHQQQHVQEITTLTCKKQHLLLDAPPSIQTHSLSRASTLSC